MNVKNFAVIPVIILLVALIATTITAFAKKLSVKL